MFTGILLCGAMIAANEPTGVQVMLVYSESEGTPDTKVEPWIVMTVTKSSDERVVPMTGWVALKSTQLRVFTTNGCFINGKVIQKQGRYEVELDGCNGGRIEMRATLKPGERGVFKLKGTGDVFVAVKAPKKK